MKIAMLKEEGSVLAVRIYDTDTKDFILETQCDYTGEKIMELKEELSRRYGDIYTLNFYGFELFQY